MLSGCAPDVRSTELSRIDLTDMKTLQEIRSRLSPEEGAALASYAIRHSASSHSFCGEALLGSNGKPPETVGEAIELALVRDAAERRQAVEAARPKTPLDNARDRWETLISERDMVIDAQSMLRAKHGLRAESLHEWKALGARLADVDERLVKLKPQLSGSKR